ncbi:unknown [Roseburia sp. CAG:309]|nr:unknown [Roseburia sp. CAG:309]
MIVTSLCSFLGFFEQSFCSFWERLDQTCITCFVVQEVLVRTVSFFGCQSEWVLSFCLQVWIEAEQVPVSSLNRFLHLILAMVHTTLSDTVEFARSVTNDQRWSVVSFCFCNRFYSLSRVCTKSDLCYVYVTIAHSDLSKTLLTDFFSGSSKLTNFTDVRSFRCLTTCIGVHLCIEYHYVYVLTGCKYVIQTTKSDVVSPTVTTEDPYGLLSKVLFLIKDFLGKLTASGSSFFDLSNHCFCSSSICFCIIFCLKVFIYSSFQFSRCFIGSSQFFYFVHGLLTKNFLTNVHTKTMLSIVLEQGVCPSRTLFGIFVYRIW